METGSQKLLLVIGVIVFAVACRAFRHPVTRKMGALSVLGASYLAAYFIFKNHVAGVGAILAWFFLPWIELLTRIRKLRLPLDKKMEHKMPPSPNQFPDLRDFTDEIEEAGYEYVDDAGWDFDDMEQFYRIFYRDEDKTQVSICMNRQSEIAFAYVSITNRDSSGQSWRTWNYPFSYAMKLAPDVHANQVGEVNSFEELLLRHEEYLLANGVSEENVVAFQAEPEAAHEIIEEEVRRQLDYNLANGLIAKSDASTFRYSWRGLFYLWGQFLKDMVKLS